MGPDIPDASLASPSCSHTELPAFLSKAPQAARRRAAAAKLYAGLQPAPQPAPAGDRSAMGCDYRRCRRQCRTRGIPTSHRLSRGGRQRPSGMAWTARGVGHAFVCRPRFRRRHRPPQIRRLRPERRRGPDGFLRSWRQTCTSPAGAASGSPAPPWLHRSKRRGKGRGTPADESPDVRQPVEALPGSTSSATTRASPTPAGFHPGRERTGWCLPPAR